MANSAIGQKYSGTLSEVKQDGLHLVGITPGILSACGGTLDHFRILDKKNNEVPYAKFSKSKDVLNLKTCKILERNSIPNKLTSIVVENSEAAKLDRLLLKIGNSAVAKHYNISGSYDNKKWFGLVYNQQINNLSEEGQTFVDREFLFPLNNYKYIKFDFIDKNSLPLNVILASYFEEGKMDVFPSVKLTGFDYKIEIDKKNKVSVIHVTFKKPQIINGVRFEITGPEMYLREAKLLVNKSREIKRNQEFYQGTLSSFQLNSKGNNYFEFEEIFEKELFIEIANQDNPVLEIKSVEFLQRPVQIVTHIKANENYKIAVDSNYVKPDYDIVNFNLNPEDDMSLAVIENFKEVNLFKRTKDNKFWQSQWFLWASILIGGILIAYFAFGLLKDLEKKN
ncbi:hypothetical protein GCM10023230_03320 [Flavobacterium hankyongi]|uniref:DUF3999 domain-containing protein n=1 Tax=Flavobacterium hankyongi TaxID=1176532 RepID=A0ABP8ZKR3_9FLAO